MLDGSYSGEAKKLKGSSRTGGNASAKSHVIFLALEALLQLISVPAVREVAGGDQSRRQKNLGQNATYRRSLTSGAIRPQGAPSLPTLRA
jgi:hypothetical protein